jgi:GAF domain-containing protein
MAAAPKIRFYAGAPLVTPDDHAIGTLCVLDCVPRQLKATQAEALRALSRQVMNQLEMRKKIYDLRDELLARSQHEKALRRHVRLAHAMSHGQRQFLHKAAHRLQAVANLIATLLQCVGAGASSGDSRETLRVTKAVVPSLLTLAREMKQHAGKPHAPR